MLFFVVVVVVVVVLCVCFVLFLFFDSQVSGLVENINIGIYSDTINGDKCQTLHDGTSD